MKRLEVDATLALGGTTHRLRLHTTGPRTVLRGPTGSGKTTLLRLIAGLEPRAAGLVRFNGHCWQDASRGCVVPAHERAVGWVPQEALLFPHLTVRENILFSPHARSSEALALADGFELTPLLGRSVRALSGGERQLVALTRALAARPTLLLLDEAFSALHASLKRRVTAALLARCEERALPFVAVTHQSEDAMLLAADELPDIQQQVLHDYEQLPASGFSSLDSR